MKCPDEYVSEFTFRTHPRGWGGVKGLDEYDSKCICSDPSTGAGWVIMCKIKSKL